MGDAAKVKEHALLVLNKPPKDGDSPYDEESLDALKMTLTIGSRFTVWVRYLPTKADKPEPWMLWIGEVVDQAIPGTRIQREKYPWVTYTAGAEGKGWKVPTQKTPFPLDGKLNGLKMDYVGFSFAVTKEPSPAPVHSEEPQFPTWEEASQLADDEPLNDGQTFHILNPEEDRFDPKYRVDNKTNAFDPEKWHLWLNSNIEYAEWKNFVRGYFVGVGRDSSDRKLVQEKVQQLFQASQLFWSTQGTVIQVNHWKLSVKKTIVFLLSRKKGQNGMHKTMVDEIINAFEDQQDPQFFQVAELKGRENFKVNRMAPSSNSVYPYRDREQDRGRGGGDRSTGDRGRGGDRGGRGNGDRGRSGDRGGRGRRRREQDQPTLPEEPETSKEQSN